MHIYSKLEYIKQPVKIHVMFCPPLTFILYEITSLNAEIKLCAV